MPLGRTLMDSSKCISFFYLFASSPALLFVVAEELGHGLLVSLQATSLLACLPVLTPGNRTITETITRWDKSSWRWRVSLSVGSFNCFLLCFQLQSDFSVYGKCVHESLLNVGIYQSKNISQLKGAVLYIFQISRPLLCSFFQQQQDLVFEQIQESWTHFSVNTRLFEVDRIGAENHLLYPALLWFCYKYH